MLHEQNQKITRRIKKRIENLKTYTKKNFSINAVLNFIFHVSVGIIIFLLGNTLLRKILAKFWEQAFTNSNDKLFFDFAVVILLLVLGIHLYQRRKNNSLIEIIHPIDLTIILTSVYSDCFHPSDIVLLPVSQQIPHFSYFDLSFVFYFFLYTFLANSSLRKSRISFDEGYLKPDLSFFEEFENDSQGSPLDLLKHKAFAEDIASAVKKINPQRGSFAIGITGPWGIGKSSFIYLLKKELLSDKKFEKETLFFWYQPLYSMPEENVVTHFLKWFEAKLLPQSGLASKAIETYINYLNSIQSSFSNIDFNEIFQDDKSFDGNKRRIESAIDHLSKRIVIVIDDLDRLNAEEIKQVFHLIKYIASFRNTIYILAYDKVGVIQALTGSSDYNVQQEKYLKKFIQLEFPIEILDPEQLKSICKIELTNKLKFMNLPYQNEVDYVMANYDITLVLQNIRDIKRFLNSFMLALSIIHEQVEFNQFFIVQLIGYYNYYAQKTLFFYFSDVMNFYINHQNKKTQTHSLNINLDEIATSEKRFNQLFPDEVVRKLVNYIFEENENYLWLPHENKNSFLNPSVRHLYFTLTNFKNDIQEIDFKIALTNSMKKCNEQFIEWSNRNPTRLIELIRALHFDPSADKQKALNVFSSLFRVFEYHYIAWKKEVSQNKHDLIVCFRDLVASSKLIDTAFFQELLDSISDDPLSFSYFILDLLEIHAFTDLTPLNRIILDTLYKLANRMLPTNSSLTFPSLRFLENLTTIINHRLVVSNRNELRSEYKTKILHRRRNEFLQSLPYLHDYFLVNPQYEIKILSDRHKRIVESIEAVFMDRDELRQLNKPFHWLLQDIIDAWDNYIIYDRQDVTYETPSEKTPDKNDHVLMINGETIFNSNKIEFKCRIDPRGNDLWRFGFQFSSSAIFSSERFSSNQPIIYFLSGKRTGVASRSTGFFIGRFPEELFDNKGGEQPFAPHDDETWKYEFEFTLSKKIGLVVMNNKGEYITIADPSFLKKFPFIQTRAWSENEPFKITVTIKVRELFDD